MWVKNPCGVSRLRSSGFARTFLTWATREPKGSIRRRTLIYEGPRLRACDVAGFDGIDLESRCADQVIRLAIEMTAPADALPVRVNRCCQRAVLISGDRPCSTKSNRPPGFRTRRISRYPEYMAFPMPKPEVQVITIVSKTASAKGPCARSRTRSRRSTALPCGRNRRGEGGSRTHQSADGGTCRADKPRAQTHRRENSPAVAKPKLTSSFYYRPRPEAAADLELLKRLDRIP
jgi:hypothetical protein